MACLQRASLLPPHLSIATLSIPPSITLPPLRVVVLPLGCLRLNPLMQKRKVPQQVVVRVRVARVRPCLRASVRLARAGGALLCLAWLGLQRRCCWLCGCCCCR